MPLAGYPSEDLYPAEDLFPGVASLQAIFRTPERNLPAYMEGHLIALLPHAMSVWRLGGVWDEGFAPSPDVVAAADRFYRGGYEHRVDDDEVDELVAAGYADRITVIEEES